MVVPSQRSETHEIVGGAGPLVLTCEHASDRLPSRWAWPDADRRLHGTHWTVDLGAADLTRELATRLHAPAVLAGATRLLVDLNRPLRSPTLFRTDADGLPIMLNHQVDPDDRARRLRYYHAYHDAVDQVLASLPGADVLSLHSFTPVYEGQRRALELGVLFDEDEAWALEVHAALEARGWRVRLNEPYSGRGGLMFSPRDHALRAGARALELEVRQDLAVDPSFRAELVEVLARCLTGPTG